jgi:hypothetical protein
MRRLDAIAGAAFVGGETQGEATRGAGGLLAILSAVADADLDLHDFAGLVEADDDSGEEHPASARLREAT